MALRISPQLLECPWATTGKLSPPGRAVWSCSRIFWLIEKMAHFNRERIVHAKGSAAFGTLTITHDISKYGERYWVKFHSGPYRVHVLH